MKCAAIQMTSSGDVSENLSKAELLIQQAANQGAELVLLPENFSHMQHSRKMMLDNAEIFGQGIVQTFLSEQAAKHKMIIVGGSVYLRAESFGYDTEPLERGRMVYSTSLVYGASGERIAHYCKQHLFDVDIKEGMPEVRRESRFTAYGPTFTEETDVLPLVDTAMGKLGLSICYDLRFPEYYRLLSAKGMSILLMPAAFTVTTGEAHWEVLLRARAIENQVYVIAAAQTGLHSSGRITWGNSMIIGPWGRIHASAADFGNKEGVVVSEIYPERIKDLRKQMPCLKHRRYI